MPALGPSWPACSRGIETGGHSGCEDVTSLVDVEGAAVAEHIHPPGVRRAGLKHRTADHFDVRLAVVAELRGNDVGAKKRGLVGDGLGDPQRADLVLDRQPVAALALESRDAGTEQLVGEQLDAVREAWRRRPLAWRPPSTRCRLPRKAGRSSAPRTRPTVPPRTPDVHGCRRIRGSRWCRRS